MRLDETFLFKDEAGTNQDTTRNGEDDANNLWLILGPHIQTEYMHEAITLRFPGTVKSGLADELADAAEEVAEAVDVVVEDIIDEKRS